MIAALFPIASATAGISGHPAAVCGGVMMTVDEFEKELADGFTETAFSPHAFSEDDLLLATKHLDQFEADTTKDARNRIATYLNRAKTPGVRATAFVFAGEEAIQFLKKSAATAREIGNQAKRNKIFTAGAIGAFGVRSVISLASVPFLLTSESETRQWLAIPTLIGGLFVGKPVIQALLRIPKSPLEKFMLAEFENLAANRGGPLRTLSLSTKKISDLKTLATLEQNLRAPWAERIIVTSGTVGMSRMRRVYARQNPFYLPKENVHVDLLALPLGPDGVRQVIVLAAEGY